MRHLRYFVVVAEEASFTRAALRLRIAQPPLSNQIKQLEKELGAKLFDRNRRGVRLTEAGRVLLEETRRVLAQLEGTARLVRRVDEGAVGRLALGFVPSASNSVLPPLLGAFGERYPEVEMYLNEMNPDALVRGLHERRIDAAFLYLPFEDAALSFRVVSRECLIVALPETHHLSGEPDIDVRELSEERFVLPARYLMPGLYSQVIEACREAGFVPKAVHKEVWLMQTIVGLVAGKMGVALVPASLNNLHRKGVVYRPVRGMAPTVEMGVVWRREESSAVLDAFLRLTDEISETMRVDAKVSR